MQQATGDDIDTIERAADRAAASGDLATAHAQLERVLAQAPDRLDSWLKLAAIRRARRDLTGAQQAITGALKIDPLHFTALLSRGHLLEAMGQPVNAARDYTRALAQLPPDHQPSGTMAGLIAHARAISADYMTGVGRRWDAALGADVPLSSDERKRVERFKTNALRHTRPYHSEPTHYHYPGLAEREFHDRASFPWLATLEAATSAITAELRALMSDHAARAEPYIDYGDSAPLRQWSALNRSLDWTAFHLLNGGRRVDENADRCPATMATLAAIDQPDIAGRSPNAMFSLLKPRTRIPPHTGVANTRLVCHLPLIIPEGCWFRVGAETRQWQPGEAFVFDDTIEHEAANDSDEPRIILIVDTWHPGLSAGERLAVKRMMEADDAEPGALL